MISAIIELVLKGVVPVIDFFIKREDRNREMKEKMFKMIDRQSKSMQNTINLRRDYEDLKNQAKEFDNGNTESSSKKENGKT